MNNKTIPVLLHQVASRLDSHCNQVLVERLNIGLSQLRILLVLQERDGRPQREVAVNLLQTEASISRQVKLLRAKGLIEAQANQQNKREHLLYLTSKGARLTDRCTVILNDYLLPKFEVLSEKEQNNLRSYLFRLRII